MSLVHTASSLDLAMPAIVLCVALVAIGVAAFFVRLLSLVWWLIGPLIVAAAAALALIAIVFAHFPGLVLILAAVAVVARTRRKPRAALRYGNLPYGPIDPIKTRTKNR